MKRQFTILLLLFAFTTFGQTKLEGTFCTTTEFVGSCLVFKNDSLFEYSDWSCLSSEKGRGKYKRNKKYLTLTFISEDTLENTVTEKEIECNMTDTITLNVLLIDRQSNESLPFAKVWITSLPNNKGAFTDLNGNATLKVKRTQKELEINVSYVGYKQFSYKTKADNCKRIQISLADGFNSIVVNGTQWEYKIKKEDSSKLTLRKDKFDMTFFKQETKH